MMKSHLFHFLTIPSFHVFNSLSNIHFSFGPVGKDYLYHSMMELNRVGIDSVDNLGNDEETGE